MELSPVVRGTSPVSLHLRLQCEASGTLRTHKPRRPRPRHRPGPGRYTPGTWRARLSPAGGRDAGNPQSPSAGKEPSALTTLREAPLAWVRPLGLPALAGRPGREPGGTSALWRKEGQGAGQRGGDGKKTERAERRRERKEERLQGRRQTEKERGREGKSDRDKKKSRDKEVGIYYDDIETQ